MLPLASSAVQVCASTTPVWPSPTFAWNCLAALAVVSSKLPVGPSAPVLNPAPVSRHCAVLTRSPVAPVESWG